MHEKYPVRPTETWVAGLTHGLLAVKDVEVVVHACSQEQVFMSGMPLESPHSSTHGSFTEGLSHVPPVPQQHVFIITKDQRIYSVIQITDTPFCLVSHREALLTFNTRDI